MLAVYLVWICGHTAIDLSCYIERQHNHAKYHLTHCEMCDCHHSGWQTPHFESPHACNHDHSVEVKLYNHTKRTGVDVEPLMLYISYYYSQITIEDIGFERKLHSSAHKIPIPQSPTLLGRTLRAPPVVA